MTTTIGVEAPPVSGVAAAIAAIAAGEFVVVVDSHNREHAGALIMAADLVTTESMAFLIRHTSGLVRVGMTGERLDDLELPLMVGQAPGADGTAFTVSVDLRLGVTTGISASDRAATTRALVDPATTPGDLARPGHIFPVRAHPGGVLRRPGHPEAAVDLARLAGRAAAGVLCELVNADGTLCRGAETAAFADRHGLPLITIDDLEAFRQRREQLVVHRSAATLPTPYGSFTVHAYESLLDGVEHLALVRGDFNGPPAILARLHSECLTGDVFGSERCDCGAQLRLALQRIAQEGRGVLVYLRAHADVPDDCVGAQILADLGVRPVRLMTNKPAECEAIAGYGVDVVDRVPLTMTPTAGGAGCPTEEIPR